MKRADLRGGRNQPVPGCHPRSDRIMPRQVQSREQSGEQDPLSGASTSSSGSSPALMGSVEGFKPLVLGFGDHASL
jgi:hypothetical protein